MFAAKLFACAVLLVVVSGRSLVHKDYDPHHYLWPEINEESSPILENEEVMVPIHLGREKRQVQGSLANNPDGTSSLNLKLPFAGNDRNKLSAIGGIDFKDIGVNDFKDKKLTAGTAGLAYDHINGHGMTLTKTYMPGFGDRLAAGGRLNLFHNDNHNLDANAFVARTTLNNHAVPSFNTVGGGVDYMFKNKVGAGLSMARTPLFDKTDYSAHGNLNLFRNRDSSLDFRAGLSKSISPYIPSRSWEPSAGLTFTKYF